MSELHNKKCIACDGSIPAFDVEEIHKYLKKVDGWDVLQNQEKIIISKRISNLVIMLKVKNLLLA